jgi:HK97 gp10 family phage protein
MASVSRVFPENLFDEALAAVTGGLVQEVARAANATRNRARQNIVNMDAILTGDMWRSVGVAITDGGESAEVYVGVDYASYVHDGTEKMRARPFLDMALAAQVAETETRLATMFNGAP